ncbi:BatD family protein [Luteimonas sp. gir]|uniref:BatD family protein n=1 Tax=Luteimonas sp. gir TaxID=3127960 RepID=UPI003075E511
MTTGVRTWRAAVVLAVLLACLAGSLQAQTRAWLDRDQIALGETTTLNVETDEAVAVPDWSGLTRDFELSGHTSRRQVEIRNGRQIERALFGVALRPRREGRLTVPPLQVGGARTDALSLTVGPAPVRSARDGAAAFVEAELETDMPYVQQAVGYTLRLHYAVPLVSGQLEQPEPEGASLQRIGNDITYSREFDGRRYNVVERRFLLVPERSGPLTIPGARFEGRGAGGGFFDDLFDRGPRQLSANGPATALSVRAMPGTAPQPWLPLRNLDLRWLDQPERGRAGAATTLTLEATFDGAVGTQLPEISLPAPDGAQVFAEPPQYDERFDEGRPRVRMTRRFSIVPRAAGSLHVAGPRVGWWDVRAGAARTSAAPDLHLAIDSGDGDATDGDADTQTVATAPGLPAARGADGEVSRVWPWLAALFALLWLATSVVAWHGLRRARAGARGLVAAVPGAAPVPRSRSGGPSLATVLQTGDPAEVDAALRALVDPPAADLEALRRVLGDAGQRDALVQWQRARWGGGDLAAARAALRQAFRAGARVAGPATPEDEAVLPPLYPRR